LHYILEGAVAIRSIFFAAAASKLCARSQRDKIKDKYSSSGQHLVGLFSLGKVTPGGPLITNGGAIFYAQGVPPVIAGSTQFFLSFFISPTKRDWLAGWPGKSNIMIRRVHGIKVTRFLH